MALAALLAISLEDALELSDHLTGVTHDHPQECVLGQELGNMKEHMTSWRHPDVQQPGVIVLHKDAAQSPLASNYMP